MAANIYNYDFKLKNLVSGGIYVVFFHFIIENMLKDKIISHYE